jgi:DNA helicase IV
VLTPERLLTDLFSSADRLAIAAKELTADERALLLRSPYRAEWTPADVPLLDEAAELLGEDTSAAEARAERLRRARIAYAQGALDVVLGSRSLEFEDEDESEILAATDVIDAGLLAERHDDVARLSAAERAAADRAWAFGHVIVDEAQELSAMAWRLLMRRCPARSMTVVGDVAQTSDPAGTSLLGAGLRALGGRPVAAGRAERQLPHPRRDHGRRRVRARRHRPGPRATAIGAGDG